MLIRGDHLVGYGTPPPILGVEGLRRLIGRAETDRRRLEWAKRHGGGRVDASAGQPLHIRFARLHGAKDDELRRFAQRHGMLGFVEDTAGRFIEAMALVVGVLEAEEGETLGDVEEKVRAESRRAHQDALQEALRRASSGQAKPAPRREPIREWRKHIDRVWACLRLADAANRLWAGEEVHVEAVREALTVLGADGMVERWDTSTPLARVEQALGLQALIAEAINSRGPIQYRMTLSGGELVQVPVVRTLLDCIYASLALALDGGLPARFCKECGRPFVPTRADQEYCPPEPGQRVSRCSNRARQRALREKRRQKPE